MAHTLSELSKHGEAAEVYERLIEIKERSPYYGPSHESGRRRFSAADFRRELFCPFRIRRARREPRRDGGRGGAILRPSGVNRLVHRPGRPPQGTLRRSAAPAPAEERAAYACCLVVIAGKVFFCSRCHLATYCGKDCQASGGF